MNDLSVEQLREILRTHEYTRANKDWIWLQAVDDMRDKNMSPGDVYRTFVIERRCGWNHSTFENYSREQQQFDDYIAKPPDVVSGVLKCPKCSSDRVYSMSKQVRSGDEATTVFAQCARCNNKWTAN